MPYKCTVCNKIYPEGSDELKNLIKRGSCECGKIFLLYIREERKPLPREPARIEPRKTYETPKPKVEPSKKETDIEWLDREFAHVSNNFKKPIHLDIETIKRIEEGKFEVDIGSLMSGKPLVVKVGKGTYYIDLPHAMSQKGIK